MKEWFGQPKPPRARADPIRVLARMQAQDPKITAFYVSEPFRESLIQAIANGMGSDVALAFAEYPRFNGCPVVPYPVETTRSFVVGIRPRGEIDDFLHDPFLFTGPQHP